MSWLVHALISLYICRFMDRIMQGFQVEPEHEKRIFFVRRN